MTFRRVASTAELADGRGVAVDVDGRPIAVFQHAGKVYAVDNLCPHAGAQLARGQVSDGYVICPLHGARFDLATGDCRTPRLAGVPAVVTHEVKIVDGHVEVDLSAEPMKQPLRGGPAS